MAATWQAHVVVASDVGAVALALRWSFGSRLLEPHGRATAAAAAAAAAATNTASARPFADD